jgi:hypothetical protein
MRKIFLAYIIVVMLFLNPSYILAQENNSLEPVEALVVSSQVFGSGCILVYADGQVFGAPNTIVDQALQSLGYNYRACYDGDFAGFETSLKTQMPCCMIFDNQWADAPNNVYDALEVSS